MDEDLNAIKAIQDGDESALLFLMDTFRGPIFRLAYRYVGNSSDAQWLAEDIFTKIYFNASKYRPHASVNSWIFAVAANCCRDFLRREKRHRWMRSFIGRPGDDGQPQLEEILPDKSRDPAATLIANERLADIQRAIQSLPEKYRFLFVFCVLEGHSHEDAAAVLKITRKTVESRIYRARKVLQARLDRQ